MPSSSVGTVMAYMEIQATINRPAAEVFDYLVQPRNRPEWQSSLKEVRGAPAEPNEGATWTDVMSGPLGEATVEVTGFERPNLYQERVTSGMGDGEVTVRLEEAGTATDIRVAADMELKGWFRYVGPLLMPLMKRGFRDDLQRLGERLEQQR